MKLREMILFQLEHYNQMQAEIDTLKFEMRNLNRMKDEEVIEALTFSAFLGDRVESGGTSDKTAGIALSYHERLKQLRDDAKASISVRLSSLVLSINRLDFYISKLPPVEGAILREYYIEEYSWRDLQELKGISSKTLIRYRDEALEKLEKMYAPLVEAGIFSECNR